MWYFIAIISALFYSFRGILEKRIIHNVDKYVLGLAIRLFALPFFFLPFIWNKHLYISPLHLNLQFWFAIAIICCVSTPIETILYYKALRAEEVTLLLPILSLSPALTLLFGTVVFHEIPTIFGILGVILLVFGIYVLKINHAREGILQPIHHLKNNPAVRLMLLVMISQAFSAIWDKMGVSNSNAYMYAVVNYIGVTATLFLIAWYKAKHNLGQLISQAKNFAVIGIVIAAYTIFYFIALESGFAGYVSAIKSSYILFTMILGILFLREKDTKQKLLSGVFIVIGLIFIKLFG